jgi:hypothetical protein
MASGCRASRAPLSESDWVLGAPERLMRIALHGVRGPDRGERITWNLDMPGQGHLSDEELAQVLSYLRRTFGHRASTGHTCRRRRGACGEQDEKGALDRSGTTRHEVTEPLRCTGSRPWPQPQ